MLICYLDQRRPFEISQDVRDKIERIIMEVQVVNAQITEETRRKDLSKAPGIQNHAKQVFQVSADAKCKLREELKQSQKTAAKYLQEIEDCKKIIEAKNLEIMILLDQKRRALELMKEGIRLTDEPENFYDVKEQEAEPLAAPVMTVVAEVHAELNSSPPLSQFCSNIARKASPSPPKARKAQTKIIETDKLDAIEAADGSPENIYEENALNKAQKFHRRFKSIRKTLSALPEETSRLFKPKAPAENNESENLDATEVADANPEPISEASASNRAQKFHRRCKSVRKFFGSCFTGIHPRFA